MGEDILVSGARRVGLNKPWGASRPKIKPAKAAKVAPGKRANIPVNSSPDRPTVKRGYVPAKPSYSRTAGIGKPKLLKVKPNTARQSASVPGALARGFKAGVRILNPFGCGGGAVPSGLPPCESSTFDPDGKVSRNLMRAANMRISNGKFKYTVEVDVPADGFGNLPDQLKNGDLYVKVFSSPLLIGANEKGELVIKQATDPAQYSACATEILNCSPFPNLFGLVPVGVIKTVKLPAEVVEGSPDAAKYAVGGKMLKEVGGEGIYAVWSRMEAVVTENGASVLKPVWEYTKEQRDSDGKIVSSEKFSVVEIKCESEDLDLCPASSKYYRVDANGAVTTEEVVVDDPSKLTEKFTYYQILPNGQYYDTNADGSPKANPGLESRDFEVLRDESVTLSDIINGNPDKDLPGLAKGADGNLDLSQLVAQQLNLSARVVAVDLRNPSQGTRDVASNTPITGAENAAEFQVDPSRAFYSNGQFKFRLRIEFSGDTNLVLPKAEYVYTSAIDTKVLLRNVPEDSCTK